MSSIFTRTLAWLASVGPAKLGAGVFVAAICGVGGYYTVEWVAGRDALASTEQEYVVTRGDLSQTVSTSGTLQYANSAELRFPLEGTLAALDAEEGEEVAAGQVLALLDDATTAALERAVAEAQLDLRDAESAFAIASKPAEGLPLAEAQTKVATAQLTLDDADFALREVEAGLNSSAVVAAQAGLDAARADYDASLADLETVEDEWNSKVAEADNDATDAIDAYERAIASWFGPMDGVDLAIAPSVLVAGWDVTYTEIWESNTAYVSAPEDDDTTPWDEYTIWLWDRLYPDEVQPTCASTVPSGWRCIEQELDDAWDGRLAAQQTAATVRTQSATAVNSSRVKVTTTESSLAKAQQTLNSLVNPATLVKRQAELDAAAAKLVDAESELAAAMEVDAVALRLASAKLTQAESVLDIALRRLEGAALTAPFDGVIRTVGADEGDEVSAETIVLEVVDTSAMRISASVDEIDVLSISRGDSVRVTMDALPGRELDGTITSIGGAGASNQGVVTFPVIITVTLPEGLSLPAGLSATAEVVVQEVTDVLLVPSQAISGSLLQPTVRVRSGGKTEAVPVELGASDDFWVVVTSGLNEGDVIVMTVAASGAGTGFTQLPGGGIVIPGGGFNQGSGARPNFGGG